MLKKAILFTCCSFLLVFSSVAASDSGSTTSQPTAPEVWPKGTRLIIPERVMKRYQEESDSWSYPSVYLFANYFFTAPSLEDKRKETVYIPFVREQAGDGEQREVMMDIMNIRRSSDNDSVFITLQRVNPNDIPFQASSINEKGQNTDSTTQAAANCIMCAQAGEQVNNQDQTTIVHFVSEMSPLLRSPQNRKIDMNLELENTIKNFCESCGEVDIADFINYVDAVATEQKISTNLLLSIMYRESSGNCNAKNSNDNSKEVGLFQLNMNDSTGLKECKNGTPPAEVTPEEMKRACFGSSYRGGTSCNPTYNLNPTVCLNNPYCNVEEAVNQINCKWLTEHANKCTEDASKYSEVCNNPYNNQSPRMPDKPWEEMSSKEKNLWRSTLLTYQRGHDFTFPSKEKMKSKLGANMDDDIWALSLHYYGQLLGDMKKAEEENSKGNSSSGGNHSQEIKTETDSPECKSVDECGSIVNSLSYVHTILGFEYEKNEEKKPPLIDSWREYRENNNPLRCPEENTNSE